MRKIICLFFSALILLGCKKEESIAVLEPVDVLESGVLIDSRDHEVYKTVKVGNQEWMIENLRYRCRLGSIDGCWSYNELAVDTTQIVIDKVKFEKEVLKQFPNIAKFGDVYMWPWILIKDSFINSRGTHYARSWNAFKIDIYNLYYGGIPDYEPLIVALDEIALSLKTEALIQTLEKAVIKENVAKYGYLYEFKALNQLAPPGWRVPSDQDFKILEVQLGLGTSQVEVMEEWRACSSNFQNQLAHNSSYGGTIIIGINNQRTPYRNLTFRGYYWTTTQTDSNLENPNAIIRAFEVQKKSIYRGSNTAVKVANSVICVRDIK